MLESDANRQMTVQEKLRLILANHNTLESLLSDDDAATGLSAGEKTESSFGEAFIPVQLVTKELPKTGNKQPADATQPNDQQPISMAELFSSIAVSAEGKQLSPPSKVLMLGVPGVGKSTLLGYVGYKWARQELWNDRFDFVFRLKLKLMSCEWMKDYKSNIDRNLLECFIHYNLSLDASGLGYALSLEDVIVAVENKEKVLLLLDGYDEIACLANDNSRLEAGLMSKVFYNYKSFLMTSRPNAVDEKQMSLRFDRLVENIGMTTVGIRAYIFNHFTPTNHALSKELTQFLAGNQQVFDICKVPMNLALLCLIWRDAESRHSVSSGHGLTLGQLYEEIVAWLGKRYKMKVEHAAAVQYGNKSVLPEEGASLV